LYITLILLFKILIKNIKKGGKIMESIISAILSGYSVVRVDDLFSRMSAEERVNLPYYFVLLQESNDHEVREFGSIQTLKLTEEQIVNNFSLLLKSKSSKSQTARDLASQILNRLSQENLVKQFSTLILSLRSDFYFVSNEAERLIDSIEIKLLFGQYNNLQRLLGDESKNIRRVASKLLVKMILAWPIETKICRQKQLAKMSHLEEFKEICILTSLQVAQFWSDDKVVNNLNYFIKQTKYNDFVISELAAKLALRALLLSPVLIKQENIKYITNFHYFGNTDLRRKFRLMALSIIPNFPTKELPNFFDFLMQCQEAKDLEVRRAAWNLLSMINPNDLVVENLVNWQASASKGPKRVARILASKISPEKLAEKLEYFIDCQKMSDIDIRDFASQLALKINRKYLQDHHDYLMFRLNGKFINPKYLLVDLIRKADVGFTFSEKITYWLYWKIQDIRTRA
jgi:hypothetical protein